LPSVNSSQLANAFQAGDYEWLPDTVARAVSEVFVHVACGTFTLLESLGTTAPGESLSGVAGVKLKGDVL